VAQNTLNGFWFVENPNKNGNVFQFAERRGDCAFFFGAPQRSLP
jgi:hypothetical protein